jgi:hypothetical protein
MASRTPLERTSLAAPTAAAVTFNKNSQFNIFFVITAHCIALVALALDEGKCRRSRRMSFRSTVRPRLITGTAIEIIYCLFKPVP